MYIHGTPSLYEKNCSMDLGLSQERSEHNFNIVSFNMHGFNQGMSTVHDLCSSHKYSAIFVQEHWLFPHNIDSLFCVSDEYSGYGVSAMVDKLDSGVFLWKAIWWCCYIAT